MPAAKLGRGSFIKIGEESSWGGGGSTPVSNRIISESLLRKQERSQKTHLSTSSSVFAFDSFDAMEICEGTITTNILYNSTGQLLKAGIGTVTTAADTPVAGSHTHTYVPADELVSLQIDLNRGNSGYEGFTGMMVSSWNLSIEAGGIMEATFNFIGKTGVARSASSLTSSFSAGNVNVRHFDAGQLSFNSVNYDVRSITMNVDNKLERRDLLGSKLTAQPSTTDIRTVELEVVADLEDNNLYNAQLDGTISDVVITFSQGSPTQSFQITLFNAQIIEYDDSISSVGRIERTMKFQGFADLNTTPDDAYKIVIVNQQASGISN